jgi:hypothetical protein
VDWFVKSGGGGGPAGGGGIFLGVHGYTISPLSGTQAGQQVRPLVISQYLKVKLILNSGYIEFNQKFISG